MHFYRVCWIPSMGMSCFLVQNCTHFTKVSCFCVHFCSQLSPISCFVCFFACFVHLCAILCLCATVCGRQFLSRVDILMQFYGVFWEPFMGMSCFLVQKIGARHKSLVFFRYILLTAVTYRLFCVYVLQILHICVWFCANALQFVAGSSWVELRF